MSLDPAPLKETGALPHLNRLKKRPQFMAAAKGRRFHTEYFSLQIMQRKDFGGEAPLLCSRFGITITKKEGSAVERNRMRRRLRHALTSCMEKARIDCDYVLIVRRPLLTISHQTLLHELTTALKRGKPHDKDYMPLPYNAGKKRPKKSGAMPYPESRTLQVEKTGH